MFVRYTFGQLLEQQESQQDGSSTVRGTVYGSKEITFKLDVRAKLLS